MANGKKLQLHQFEINRENVIENKIFIYNWPEKLLEVIKDRSNGFRRNCSIKNLSDTITLVFDQVIFSRNKLSKKVDDEINHYWIFSLEKLDIETLKSVISEWLSENRINSIGYDDVQFEKPKVIMTQRIFEDTFISDKYAILSHLYMNEFCKDKVFIDSITKSIKFLPVIDTQSESVAISETIDYKNKNNKLERYSYGIVFRIVNNCEYPDKVFLNVYTKIKVWLSRSVFNYEKNINYITSKHNSSFYVYKENKYKGNKLKKLIHLKYGRGKGLSHKFPNYSDKSLANQLDINLMIALRNPNEFNNLQLARGLDEEEIYLLTDNRNVQTVKYGAGLSERIDIYRMVKDQFPRLTLREKIPVVNNKTKLSGSKRKKLIELKRFNEENNDFDYIKLKEHRFFYEDPPKYIPSEKQVVIEIYSDNQHLINSVIEISINILSLTMPVDKYTYKSTDGYEVVFKANSAKIARGLTKKEQKNKSLRRNEINNYIKNQNYSKKKIISLIDIHPFHKDKTTKSQDCKRVIRNTFKNKGRITQFINHFDPEIDKEKHKLYNSIYDLFTAAGFLDYNYVKYGFDKKVLLGLSPVKDSNGKLIALSKIENGKTHYKLYNFLDNKWYLIEEVLQKLNYYKLKNIKKSYIEKVKFNEWIRRELNTLALGDKNCYFYFDAVLRNNVWSFVKNGNLVKSKLRLINSDKIRFIRVNKTGEVPGYHIFKTDKDTDGINRSQGLFTRDNRVYYSVGIRGDNLQLKKGATKAAYPNKMIGKQQIVEFVILSDNEQENYLVAHESHALRRFNLSYDASMKYPLPLYLNNRFGEYLKALGL